MPVHQKESPAGLSELGQPRGAAPHDGPLGSQVISGGMFVVVTKATHAARATWSDIVLKKNAAKILFRKTIQILFE